MKTTPSVEQKERSAGVEQDEPLPCFGKRHTFALLGFAGLFMLYALRTDLGVAIVSMVNHSPQNTTDNSSKLITCFAVSTNEVEENKTKSHPLAKTFDWDSKTQNMIIGSFFWGYVVTQIPGGRLAEKFGSKQLLAYSIGLSSLLTLLSPLAAEFGYEAFVAIRVMEGLCGGVAFPSMHAMVARWIPLSERGFLSTVIYSGSQMGTVFAMAGSGILSDSSFLGGWPSVFYVFGSFGLVWFILWMLNITSGPEENTSISTSELNYILSKEKSPAQKKKSTPWKAIATSVPVWALIITHFGQNWGFYTILFQMPTYFKTILGFDIKENGLLNAIPYLLQATCGWISSFTFDYLIRHNYMEVNTVRKLSNTIGFFGPAACLIGITVVECNKTWNVILVAAAMAFNGFYYCGFNVTHVDMAPEYAGTLMGITNCLANFAGTLAPFVVGLITETEQSTRTWSYVFYLSAGVYVVTAIIFILFGSAKRQKWSQES